MGKAEEVMERGERGGQIRMRVLLRRWYRSELGMRQDGETRIDAEVGIKIRVRVRV